ncbi:DUF1080 domain-containing protein [Paraglaciecola sp. L3A3]|uniref:3-keto-disaccharide hydrolase n=1 Tax=Paraglaciecola sp. L3A3 TaxID=2686358 RepID=UPI00131D897B|nr:DUF1080 domain-containing protein [Paraglaciecola sp. L3A3]
MNVSKYILLSAFIAVFSIAAQAKKPDKVPTWTDYDVAMKEQPHFQYQGEYIKGKDALQVLSTVGKFYTSLYQGGLPGAGWDGSAVSHQWYDEKRIKQLLASYRKIDRSIKAGANPAPAEAIVLFDGTSTDKIKGAKKVGDAVLAGFRSTDIYQDLTLHVEFLTPYKPTLAISHPDRGNSGIYLNNAYEVQISDSFAHDSDKSAWKTETLIKKPYTWNATIYEVREPDLNLSLPALHWQSFDIDFTAPRFVDGKKVTNAKMTVFHNGIKIHDSVEVSKPTRGRENNAEQANGFIYFQNHHNPVKFRNIWLIKK